MSKIRHILLVEYKPEATEEEIEATRLAFLSIGNKISGIEDVEWGLNNSPEGKSAGYELCIQITFQDKSARDVYLDHPEHSKLKQVFRKIIGKLIVFDYSVD